MNIQTVAWRSSMDQGASPNTMQVELKYKNKTQSSRDALPRAKDYLTRLRSPLAPYSR